MGSNVSQRRARRSRRGPHPASPWTGRWPYTARASGATAHSRDSWRLRAFVRGENDLTPSRQATKKIRSDDVFHHRSPQVHGSFVSRRRLVAWRAQLIRSVSSGNRGQTALLEDSEKAVFALSDSIVQANSETRTETGRSQSPFSANPPPVYGGIEGGVHAEGDQRG